MKSSLASSWKTLRKVEPLLPTLKELVKTNSLITVYALYYMIDKVQSKYKKEPVQELAQAPSSDELKPIQLTTVKSPETCIKLISMKKTENGNVYVIKKGHNYETTTILHLAHVCNNAKFKG